VRVGEVSVSKGNVITVNSSVTDHNRQYTPSLRIDADERIIEADCPCNWHQQNRLRKGPCEHILALRMRQVRRTG